MMDDHFQQCKFKSFFWNNKADIIGAGATSVVYKAIYEDTGDYVAVKVFNERAKLRSNVLQIRELDLLQRINHENVVKLIDKDDQTGLNKYALKLIVMEYCNGGSLSSIVDLPENIYGLNQREFLLVLKHITCGMNELHRLKIVHRDIKPNNILLQIMPTGEHVYKLSDFGAARQVEMDDDQFTSICGTEEYLFPDVYERALINSNKQMSFKAEIDLWSTGVTLYHVATGLLPFRPIGGRHNRETMIKITRDKPSGYISGVQNPVDHQIIYSRLLPETCQLSKNLQNLLVPMLAGLMENNYDNMWTFQQFFDHSSRIYELTFIDVINLDTGSIVELALEKTEKLNDLKEKIEKETKIDKSSQLFIFNNLVFDLLVNENQTVDSYPIIDKEHPLVLFSLNGTLRCDNLDIIKSIPDLRCDPNPKTTSEIINWSKETCGTIYYIKREVYLVTILMELLKLSAIAFKSYVPEMKLKQQNLLYNFKSSIKGLETKLNVIEKLKSAANQLNNNVKSKSSTVVASTNTAVAAAAAAAVEPKQLMDANENAQIRNDIKKLKSDINLYEKEITGLTENINRTTNLGFLAQNSSLTSKWKNEVDALANTAHQHYNELLQQKKELRKYEQEKFENSLFTRFKLKQIQKAKENAVKLYQETISVHFYDFYSKFEKWMSDLIKLHNDLMSVQQKLVECERSIDAPIDQLDRHLDLKIDHILNQKIELLQQLQQQQSAAAAAAAAANLLIRTPPISPNVTTTTTTTTSNTSSSGTSSKGSFESSKSSNSSSSSSSSSSDDKDENNNLFQSVSSTATSATTNSKINWASIESLMHSMKDFKNQVIEIDKALDANAHLLKFLQSEFLKKNMVTNDEQ